ncbi:ABC transporter permease [Kribbella sp. NPDC004536]|uniref:ABC transporter permease n=1 Tax=Kribbella sp. NPDC004536 TaxID=3364106 RepID=UPI003693EC4C
MTKPTVGLDQAATVPRSTSTPRTRRAAEAAQAAADDVPPTVSAPRRRERAAGARRRDLTLFLIGLPALLVLLVFNYLPMAGVIVAFKDYDPTEGILHSKWIGWQNFHYLWANGDAWRVTRNTVLMNGIFIVANLVVAIGLALLLNEVKDRSPFVSRVYQSAMFLPFVLSYVVITGFVLTFLNADTGIVNHLLRSVGGGGVDWYNSPNWWPLVLTLVEMWKGVGFWVVVYLAGIISISPELYEAAAIDGASRWQQIRSITLPLLRPLVVINVLLGLSHIFNADFGLFFQVTQNSPTLYPTTDVIDTYVFRSLTSTGDVGMAAAAGLYQAFVGFVLVVAANWLVRRRGDDALF